jgi:Uma2 family endonuclease
MATATFIPISEYLTTTYRPDCDYIDGEVKERNVGEQPHGRIEAIIASIFQVNRKAWSTRVTVETRVQTLSTHFRIPDICILRSSDPHDPIIRFAPYICIEVLSKADTLADIKTRTDEYRAMGSDLSPVHTWVIDPWLRIGYIASARGFEHPADGVFTIPGTTIRIVLAEVFAELDED